MGRFSGSGGSGDTAARKKAMRYAIGQRELADRLNARCCVNILGARGKRWDGPDSYLELLEAVDRERFAVHLDVFNWMTSPRRYFYNEEFVDECFEKLGRYVKSCHLNLDTDQEYLESVAYIKEIMK